jgi:hypothetical protein
MPQGLARRRCSHGLWWFACLGLLFWPVPLLVADEPLRTPLRRLSIEPGEVVLSNHWDRVQLVVTGHFNDSLLCDLTATTSFSIQRPQVAEVSGQGIVIPKGKGETVVVVRCGNLQARVPVRVEGMDRPQAISFAQQVVPALTKAGCNAGACHGTPTGKNGFRLSLRGYDPALDYFSLTREFTGRRIAVPDPDGSLILQKALGLLPHEGGRRFDRTSPLYSPLREWIAEGAPDDTAAAPRLAGLAIFPQDRLLDAPADSQQLRVVAVEDDGTRCDVTHLARYSVNRESLARVGADGRVEKIKSGEVAVIAEYRGRMATALLTFLDPVPGFAWSAPPEHNYIDTHVFAKLKRLRIEPSPLCTDAEFLRRASLDVLGKLPAPEQVRSFLADRDPSRRSKLIDWLLEQPEFASWWALKWADRLGCNQRFVGKIGAYKYHEWIRQQMASNVPEDEFVRTILTARGGNYGNPPAGFYRRLRNPEVRAEEVSQLFLGVRVQCARCHNHPGERWTQDDYHGLAAFFARLRYRDGPFFIQIYDKEETVYVAREGDWIHPGTRQVVTPRFLGGAEARLTPNEDRLEALARWLTAPENPYFARAAVNRIWYHLFGRGIVEPVDDLRGTNPPCNEPLLEALAADFVRHGFDRKHLIRTILQSRTYQLRANAMATNEADDIYFSHARVRLLPAEALLDAISTATESPEKFPGMPLGATAVSLPDGEYKHPFLEAFGRPARAMACECERDTDTNFSQALQLVGSRTMQAKLHSETGRVARLLGKQRSNADIIEDLFLATLSRYPVAEETQPLLRRLHQAGDRRRAVEDILWALLNHREFLFQR